MNTRFAVALATFGLLHAAHAESPDAFAWRLPLATPGGAAYYRVELPEDVYLRALRADLADVRVQDSTGEPVPLAFAPAPQASRTPVAPVPLPYFPLRIDAQRTGVGDLALTLRRDAAGTRVDLSTGDGVAVRGDRLAGYLVDASEMATPMSALALPLPPGTSVTTRVRVDGSDDLSTWRPLADNAVLMAAEANGRRIARERVVLAGVPAKYLRITFAPGAPATAFVDVRGEFADHVTDVPRQWREAIGSADSATPGAYTFDLGGHFPVDRIVLQLPAVNTVAPARLYARADPHDPWQPVASSVFYRLRRDGGESVAPPLAVPMTPLRYWKLDVDAKAGGIGAAPPTLSAGFVAQSLVFAARGDGPFDLVYGSATARPAALPIATLVPGYDARTTPATFGVATIGAARVAPAMAALVAPIDRRRWLLWAVLGLATLVLGYMAWRLARDMRAGTIPAVPGAPAERAHD